ncbi:MAG: ribonuclease J, partial [Candidatus Dormibacteria bacterium]
MPPGELRFLALGGLGEVGKNLALLEVGDDLLMVDAGLAFPDRPGQGVEVLIPDVSYLRERRAQLRAVVLTHGHEDHIGALPFIMDELGVPVYGTAMTLALLANKLRRRGYRGPLDLRTVEPGEPFTVGEMECELLRLTHSVPGSAGLVLRTRAGVVFHTGDFKLDQTPVDGLRPDLGRLAELGRQGVRLLLSDSTNAQVPGVTPSELSVRPALRRALSETERRVVVVTFASNLARIRQTLELAHELGRRCCLVGWSMLRNFEAGVSLGFLRAQPGLLAQPRELPGIA